MQEFDSTQGHEMLRDHCYSNLATSYHPQLGKNIDSLRDVIQSTAVKGKSSTRDTLYITTTQ